MSNLDLYNKVRGVPNEAQKEITSGRLKGKTDINPMWRIKTLTEQFGVCGFGWKIEIVREWLEQGANGEVTANIEIKLYVKQDGAWSDAIPGIGGSALVAKETNGLHTDDDCYKKAYTDAISVACKALGIGADVYFEKDSTKYDAVEQSSTKPIQQTSKNSPPSPPTTPPPSADSKKSMRTLQLENIISGTKHTLDEANEFAKRAYGAAGYDALTIQQYNTLYDRLETKIKQERGNG